MVSRCIYINVINALMKLISVASNAEYSSICEAQAGLNSKRLDQTCYWSRVERPIIMIFVAHVKMPLILHPLTWASVTPEVGCLFGAWASTTGAADVADAGRLIQSLSDTACTVGVRANRFGGLGRQQRVASPGRWLAPSPPAYHLPAWA